MTTNNATDRPTVVPPSVRHDPYAALRIRDFRLLVTGVLIANIGMQMQTVAVAWEIYERTANKLALGLVGLVQILPVFALVLPAGHTADRFDRRRILMLTYLGMGCCSLGLAYIAYLRVDVTWIYALLLAIGTARAFAQPARASLAPTIVPRESFSNAVTWSTGSYHLACVVGPALGGALIAIFHGAAIVFVLDAAGAMTCFILLSMMRYRTPARTPQAINFRSLLAGFGFLHRTPLVFGAIVLDMFAVLLGGATMLLPVYAKDILHVGPTGYGCLQAAPAIGALSMAFILAHRPPMRNAGRALLWAVAGFGIAMIVFGLSRSFPLSLLMLFFTGFLDNVSVVIRHTLVQLSTPDEMRGRVSAINAMFIGASNELGGFESGAVAHLFNVTVSVVSGGIGTLIVVACIAILFPQLRRYGRLGGSPT